MGEQDVLERVRLVNEELVGAGSVSVGVATVLPEGSGAEAVARADAAMYGGRQVWRHRH